MLSRLRTYTRTTHLIHQRFSSYNRLKDIFLSPAYQQQVHEEADEKDRQINRSFLKRELVNDFIQMSLKFYAFSVAAPSTQMAFKAEAIRQTIEFLNHTCLYYGNTRTFAPNAQYPDGQHNMKHALVMIPSLLFQFFGMYTIYETLVELTQHVYSVDLDSCPSESAPDFNSILLYLGSLTVDSYIIFKNYSQASRLKSHSPTKDTQDNLSLKQKIEQWFQKKDPLLQAVLTENIVTFVATCIPLSVAILNCFYPMPYASQIGSLVIGGIQIHVGLKLKQANYPYLIGVSVEPEILKGIQEIVLQKQYVKGINSQKGSRIGSKFKFQAEIEYNVKEIQKQLMHNIQDQIDQITYEEDIEDREEQLMALASGMPNLVLQEIQKINSDIEYQILQQYPQCVDISLEAYVPKDPTQEEIVNLFQKQLTDLQLFNKKWIDQAIDDFLANPVVSPQQSEPSIFLRSKDYRHSPAFVLNNLTPDDVFESLLVHEDQRFQMIKDGLQEDHEARYCLFDLQSDSEDLSS